MPNMNAVGTCKVLCVPEEITEFHKVKVIFVDEDADNTS